MSWVLIEDAFDVATSTLAAVKALNGRPTMANARVFLKPNLTYPRHKPGVTTSPRFLAAVLEAFTSLGASVTVGEGDGGYGAWSADLAFEGHGLPALCRRYGAKLVNLSTVPSRITEVDVSGTSFRTRLPILLLDEVDLFVTLPVPKLHAMTVYSGAVKNQWGCIPDKMRLRRHPEFVGLVWAVNRALGPKLALGDAQYILDVSGPMVGDPVYMNRFVASDDVLAFDVTVAKHLMGLDVSRVAHLVAGKDVAGYAWQPATIQDDSTGPLHQFTLRRSWRHRVTAAAFTRQWAVNLLWFSLLGDLAHRVLYATRGNPIAEERKAVERQRHSESGLG
jgi:uncharacterized protein (DUF362 family)